MTAIFRDTGQALHVAYAMQAFESSAESLLAKMIRRHLEEIGEAVSGPSTVDFGTLSPLEVKGQCAMIRAAVDNIVGGIAAESIKARYGLTTMTRDADGYRHWSFSPERIIAFHQLAKYFGAQFAHLNPDAVLWTIVRISSEIEQLRPTFRAIEEGTGTPKSTLERLEKKLKFRLRGLQLDAIEKLTPIFERDGMVPQYEEYISA